jgi:signal transduction histidine kinase
MNGGRSNAQPGVSLLETDLRSLRGQALLCVGLALLPTLLALASIWQLERETANAVRQAEASDSRLLASESLMQRLVDAETGVRGYVATHDRLFLDPYKSSVLVMPGLIEGFRVRRLHEPESVFAQSTLIADESQAQMTILGEILRTPDGRNSVAVPRALRRGKVIMDAIRRLIGPYQSRERTLIAERRAGAIADRAGLGYALAATLVLCIAASIAVVLFFAKRVVGRLATVIAKTERIAANQEVGVPLRGNDEIVAVDRAVHLMAIAIAARNADVVLSNESLNERNEELSDANKELETFSYSVSHDLRAPIRAIDGYSRRLQREYNGHLDVEGRRLLAVIQEEAGRMGELIDDLLEFSRLGRKEMKDGPVDMTVLAREVAAGEKNASGTNVSLAVGTLPHTRGDRALLRQVWQNLIANAVKYSSTQVEPVVTVSGSAEGRLSVYHVSDNGVGFDMKYAHKLFAVFQRLHSVDEFSGTGVGLAIVKRIVARHGGRAWATAEPSNGAIFSFSLPSGEPE